jgi:hypothetical protein
VSVIHRAILCHLLLTIILTSQLILETHDGEITTGDLGRQSDYMGDFCGMTWITPGTTYQNPLQRLGIVISMFVKILQFGFLDVYELLDLPAGRAG